MSEDIKIKVDWKKVKGIEHKVYSALALTAKVLQNEIREEMVVPRKSGNLQGEAFDVDDSEVNKGRVALVHATPYARRLYYHPEYHFHREVWTDSKGTWGGNENAQGLWFRPWMKGGAYESRPQQIFSEIVKRGL